jgi:hypothetical protein
MNENAKNSTPIGGWLILTAALLLSLLYTSLDTLISSIYLIDPDISSIDPQMIVFLAVSLGLVLFSVWCAVLFFCQKKMFIRLFAGLCAVFVVYFLLSLLLAQSSIDLFGLFFFALYAVSLPYILLSKRTKNTFVYGAKEALPKEAPPLRIGGWLAVAAYILSIVLFTQLFGIRNELVKAFSPPTDVGDNQLLAFMDLFNQFSPVSLFLDIVAFVLAVLSFLFFFQRKRSFKPYFIVLMLLSIARSLYNYAGKPLSMLLPVNLTLVLNIGSIVLMAVLIVYVLVSQRVRQTFILGAPDETETTEAPPQIPVDSASAAGEVVPASAETTPSPAVTPNRHGPRKAQGEGSPAQPQQTLKERLDAALASCKAQPIGGGYVDIVTAPEYILPFIDAMQCLNVRIRAISWWCFDQGGPGCPHGSDPRQSLYFSGTFSEMLISVKEFKKYESHDDVRQYILEDFPKSREYLPCLVPGFWLDVSDDLA